MAICEKQAIAFGENGPTIDRTVCDGCFQCTEICCTGAKYISGEDYTVERLYREIEKDSVFYAASGGGVTFSGGEPLSQPEFLTEIARKCHENGIHVMLESCGFADYEKFKTALPYIDAMFMDLKHIDTEMHKKLTGQHNERILKNIRRIAEFGIPITIRTPVIPGMTDMPSNIRGIAAYIKDLPNIQGYELLAYHNLGESKYRALGRDYALHGMQTPEKEEMFALADEANEVLADTPIRCFYMA